MVVVVVLVDGGGMEGGGVRQADRPSDAECSRCCDIGGYCEICQKQIQFLRGVDLSAEIGRASSVV